jgi:hypothetical protein
MAKDKFKDLDEDFKTNIQNMGNDEIRERIAEIVLSQRELMLAKKQDADLAEKKKKKKELSKKYRKVSELNKFRVDFAKDLNPNEVAAKTSIATSTLEEVQNLEEMANDQQLAEASALLKEANAGYNEATKANKLRVQYAYHILESRGQV